MHLHRNLEAQKHYSKSLKYYKEGLEIAKKLKNREEIVTSLYNTGLCYEDLKNYTKALELLTESKKFS
ncbi:MAG: tetratricopeptide repeat protein, partial [Candidatus Hodarchaeota archaeon]